MKEYIVYYTAYDNDVWTHRKGKVKVKAKDEKEAKEIVKSYSDCTEEYFVEKVEEKR